MHAFSLVRTALPFSALVAAVGVTGVIFAQSFDADFDFNMTATFPSFHGFPFSSEYVECVAPAVRAHEDALVRIHIAYERHKVRLIELRAQARTRAWRIPERSARSRALRDIDRAFRENDRALSRWLRDQERSLKRQFNDAEDRCDDQFDDDVDFEGDGRSSRSSSRSSSSRMRCDTDEIACSPLSEIVCGCPGQQITFVACRSDGCARCPRCPASSSRSSSSSSSRSSFHTTSFQGDASFKADGTIESCSCDIVCDPSGSPCMAVCSAEC